MKLKLLFIFLIVPAFLSARPCASKLRPCGWWGEGEYVRVVRKARYYPPLVTTSPIGTPAGTAGVLGLPTTSILFGG